MSRLKQLIHEVHRRSLWQVLGIYVVGGWIALQVVDTMAGALKLPDWSSPVALLLLIIGLPIVLATAFVQEGVGRREPGEVERTSGGTPIPGAPDEGARTLFTWKNAILGGLVAFALWGVVATAWLFLGTPGAGAGTSGSDAGAIESIAVLKFVNMSGDEENEYFAAGMSEQLLDALAKVPGLRVAARTSSFLFEGEDVDVREVGEALDVEAVLEGSVRRDGDRVRITAQLVNAEDGFHVWSETYDRRMVGIFDLQDEITRSIVEELQLQLPGADTVRLVKAPTGSMDAYDLYLRARHVWNQRTQEGLERALEYFGDAIALDSTYALAWAGLSDTYSVMDSWGYMPASEAMPPARHAAERALALDASLAEAHAALGLAASREGDFDTALAEFQRAIEINPNYASAHQWYSSVLSFAGRRDEALAEARTAHGLDPLSAIISDNLADALDDALLWEEALAQNEKTLELDPAFGLALVGQSNILADLGRFDEALALALRARELNPSAPPIAIQVADVLAAAGEYERALSEALPVLEAFPEVLQTYISGGLYLSYLYTDQFDEALAVQERAHELSAPPFFFLTDIGRAEVAAFRGDTETARRLLTRAEEGRAQSPASSLGLTWAGLVYVKLGDYDRAFQFLERAFEENPGSLSGMKFDRAYDPVRSDPRFDDLIVRMGLDDASLTWLDQRDTP